jgi:phage terminase large subunit GpA-like protein
MGLSATLSDVAEAWILLDGKAFRLDDWPMHRAFYDGRYKRTLFKTSRQVGKSTTLANFSIIECTLIPYFSTMFVSPSKEQTTIFSNSRVAKTMRYSPKISSKFLRSDLADRVFHKEFTNGSTMFFKYALDDGDRLRGPSTDRNMYDEVQDLLYDPVVIVGNETLSESDYQYETYAGTPKTMENTIQYLWELSTQAEWVMKCDGCGKHQFIDSEKAIGKLGPICLHCSKYLNPLNGQWIEMNPHRKDSPIAEDQKLKGFHVSRLIMPRDVPLAMKGRGSKQESRAEQRWQRILRKYEESPPSLFRNEVLGVSDAIGTRIISQEELQALCTGEELTDSPIGKHFEGVSSMVAGVDWSGGGQSGTSRTVLWIWGVDPHNQKLVCKYYKVYPGSNPVHSVDDVARVCTNYRVAMVVGDAGEGALANDQLRHKLGHHRVQQVQYGAQKRAIEWNGNDRYQADRTTLIDNYFMLLKKQGVVFGPEPQMRLAIQDILAEYEEVTHAGKKVWRHSPQKPDDCLHAGLFGWVAFKLSIGDLKFYQ